MRMPFNNTNSSKKSAAGEPVQQKKGSHQNSKPGSVAQRKLAAIAGKSNSVVQRYSIVQPDDLKAQKNATVETQELSQSQYGSRYSRKTFRVNETGFNPSTEETTKRVVTGARSKKDSTLPPFKVSQKGLMALPAQGQAKVFYTDTGRIDFANKKLKEGGSKVRLKQEGLGITVPKNPENPNKKQMRMLQKVHAAMEVPNNLTGMLEVQIQQGFPPVQCNEFVRLITGASYTGARMAVLESTGKPNSRREVLSEEGDEPVQEIATLVSEGLSKTPNTVSNLLTNQPPTQTEKETGIRSYETISDEKYQARTSKLGINEYANPQVGEGLVIRSLDTNVTLDQKKLPKVDDPSFLPKGHKNSKGKKKKMRKEYIEALDEIELAGQLVDKSRIGISALAQRMMRTWGEHYAGIVARDGSDMVTMENYNRSTEISWEYERIFNNLFRDFESFSELVVTKLDSLDKTPDKGTIRQLIDLALKAPNLENKYKTALEEAVHSFDTGLRKTNQTYDGNFYFEMYGTGTQSFHSAFKGLTSNPVTLRITETIQPVIDGAKENIKELHDKILKWEPPILVSPMNGQAQTRLTNIINTAKAAELLANQQMLTAKTRGDYGDISSMAGDAWNTFQTDIRQEVMSSYQFITGAAPVPAANSFADLSARCTTFLNSYYWFNKADAPYNNITQLRGMLQALIHVNL